MPPLTGLAPLGKFLLEDPVGRTVVLVATGVGLAPFLPMLEQLRAEHPSTPTWLFYGNRLLADMVAHPDLEALARKWENFHFVPILSRPPENAPWYGATGHVQDQIRACFPDLSKEELYLCGSTRMVNETQAMALALGCPRSHVHVDRWGDHST